MTNRSQQEVFDRWLADHRGLLFKVVRAYAATPHDQDDLFQEISVQVWKSIPGFRGESAETTWLYRVALMTAISWLRSHTRHRHTSIEEAPQVLRAARAARDERLDWLYAQIRQLNEIDRSVTLLLLDGFTYQEIAETLGLSSSNVGVKIHRIKKHLTARFREEPVHGV